MLRRSVRNASAKHREPSSTTASESKGPRGRPAPARSLSPTVAGRVAMPRVRLRLFPWLLLLALVPLAVAGDGRLTAQDKSKAPPAREEEDPAAKGKTRPVPRV